MMFMQHKRGFRPLTPFVPLQSSNDLSSPASADNFARSELGEREQAAFVAQMFAELCRTAIDGLCVAKTFFSTDLEHVSRRRTK